MLSIYGTFGEVRGEGREDRRVEERRGEWLDDHVRQHLLTYLFFCSPSHLICVHILNNWWRYDCIWYVLWHLYLFICLLFFCFCFLFLFFVLFCFVLFCFVLFCFVLFCFVSCRFILFLFLFFVFCFLFFVSYRNESIPTLNFKSRNYLTCFRHHLTTTRSGTRVRWIKRSERHRAHIYCSPWYWCLMASLHGSLVAPSPSRTMLSRMLVSLTSISDTLNTYHLLSQPQQFRTSLATC